MAEKRAERVKVTLVRSIIGESRRTRATVRALGLRRLNSSREHVLTPQIEGMLRQVAHLVKVEKI